MQKWDAKMYHSCLFCADFSESGDGDSSLGPERRDWPSSEGEDAAEAEELDAGELLETRS